MFSDSSVTATLEEALRFSAEDLAANRAGQLSEPQRRRLQALRRRSVIVGLVLVFSIGLVGSLLVFAGQRAESSVLTLVGVGVTVCNAVLIATLVPGWFRLGGDLAAGTVTALEGTTAHTIRVTGRVRLYIVRIGGEELAVSKPLFFALKDGAPYRMYRAPQSKTLLSVEAL